MKRSKGAGKKKDSSDSDLIRFGISIPADLLGKFDEMLAGHGDRQNRSEAIRDLIRDRLVQEAWTAGKGEQSATLTLVYAGGGGEFTRRLADAKKELGECVVSTLHVRMGAQDLEVLVLRGPAATLKQHADAIVALRGMLHGKLVMTG